MSIKIPVAYEIISKPSFILVLTISKPSFILAFTISKSHQVIENKNFFMLKANKIKRHNFLCKKIIY